MCDYRVVDRFVTMGLTVYTAAYDRCIQKDVISPPIYLFFVLL